MKNFINEYDLICENTNGMSAFYVNTKTNGTINKIEISENVYNEMELSNLKKQREKKSDKRHLDFYTLSDEIKDSILYKHRFYIGIDENAINNVQLKNALKTLTVKERKRLLLYFLYGYSLKEIAKKENVSIKVIQVSVCTAREKLYNLMNKTIY